MVISVAQPYEDLDKKDYDILFEGIYTRYEGKIFNVIYRLLSGNVDDPYTEAQDIMQDVFVAFYKKGLHNFRDEADPGTYLYTMALNRVRNHVKRLRKIRIYSFTDLASFPVSGFDYDGEIDFPDETSLTPELSAVQSELGNVVHGALSHLHPEYREAIVLVDLQQLSYIEAAAAAGITIQSLKSRLHRAREDLRELLRPYVEA
ncbi:MAG: RNA polymerase sigma factor [Candidatus Aenigmarchaeota archaeon]|nr:RNA polymerase sigma factor [Candidatus Aenigmarchaeota archaeon]